MEASNKDGEAVDKMHFGQFEQFGILGGKKKGGEEKKKQVTIANKIFDFHRDWFSIAVLLKFRDGKRIFFKKED